MQQWTTDKQLRELIDGLENYREQIGFLFQHDFRRGNLDSEAMWVGLQQKCSWDRTSCSCNARKNRAHYELSCSYLEHPKPKNSCFHWVTNAYTSCIHATLTCYTRTTPGWRRSVTSSEEHATNVSYIWSLTNTPESYSQTAAWLYTQIDAVGSCKWSLQVDLTSTVSTTPPQNQCK